MPASSFHPNCLGLICPSSSSRWPSAHPERAPPERPTAKTPQAQAHPQLLSAPQAQAHPQLLWVQPVPVHPPVREPQLPSQRQRRPSKPPLWPNATSSSSYSLGPDRASEHKPPRLRKQVGWTTRGHLHYCSRPQLEKAHPKVCLSKTVGAMHLEKPNTQTHNKTAESVNLHACIHKGARQNFTKPSHS